MYECDTGNLAISDAQTSMEIDGHPFIQSYVAKIRQVPTVAEKTNTLSLLPVILGMLDIEASSFKNAANHLLQIPFDQCAHIWKFVAPRELAIYGCLCAMATFDRVELKAKVFENTNFKQFLELEPQVREALRAFYHSRFAECFIILGRLKVIEWIFMKG